MFEQDRGLNRNILDKFYTDLNIAKICFEIFKNHVNIRSADLIIEPSAGNGVFIPLIKSLSTHYKFLDVEPEHPEIEKQDFLKYDCKHNNSVHIIGNPPFGRQSSMAIKFIKKSCTIANSISFILPKSFRKSSLQRHFDPFFHLKEEVELPLYSFIVQEKKVSIPCIFQIWVRKDYKRDIEEVVKTDRFKFVKKTENPDIAIRRCGFYAGKVSREIEDKNINTHYFIKFKTGVDIEKVLNYVFTFNNNNVGPKSITQQDIIKNFVKVL